MSALAACDLLSRLTFNFFTDRMKLSDRSNFMIGTFISGFARSALAELTNFPALVITCALFGYFRALVIVNQILTVSEFCMQKCPEKLPGALGLNMIIKSVSVITLGQLLGWVRELTASYTISLHSQNALLSIAMIVWIIELKLK